jgi:hypothetical protein
MEKDENFARDYSIHLLCVCRTIENGMGCKKLGSKVKESKSDKTINRCIVFS